MSTELYANNAPVSTSNPLPVTATLDVGTAATGVTIPTGGIGMAGWLSGIYNRLAGVVLAAGTALIGKVGLDQTTPGTTNAVAPISGQAGVDGGAGAVSAKTQRTTLASDDPAVAALGAISGAKVVTDANGTIQQYLRGLVTFFANATGAGTAAAAHRTTLASDDPAVAVLGATSGAKVVTDATGTVQQYLRGLVTFFANSLGAGTAAAAHRTTLASDDPAVAVLGATSGAAVITDATGTVQQYLRGLVKMLAAVISVNHSTTGIGHGKKAVTTAGTDLALAGSTAAKWVMIQAYAANTGMIAVGASGVDATAATGDGVSLAKSESVTLPVDNLADVYIDATVSGEGVRFTYGT